VNDVWVLDSSAVLALLNNEAGADFVASIMAGAKISAANASEVMAKLIQWGGSPPQAREKFESLQFHVLPVDLNVAGLAAELAATRNGLSLGDRLCLATARLESAIAVTADRRWADLDLGVRVRLIR
jgi:ribonuclease VapC